MQNLDPARAEVCGAMGCHFACLMLMLLVVSAGKRLPVPIRKCWHDALRQSRTYPACAWAGAPDRAQVQDIWEGSGPARDAGLFLNTWAHYNNPGKSNGLTAARVQQRLKEWMREHSFGQCSPPEHPVFNGTVCLLPLHVGGATARFATAPAPSVCTAGRWTYRYRWRAHRARRRM